jgi:sugar lactone lactonase YvrE
LYASVYLNGIDTGGPGAWPDGLVMDAAGNIFVTDSDNNRVRKISTSGVITTVAGNGQSAYSGDGGPAVNAALYSPLGLALDEAGNLFIADALNGRIRKVSASGIITTVAGGGSAGFISSASGPGDGGPATNTSLLGASGVAVDAAGNLFIADPL